MDTPPEGVGETVTNAAFPTPVGGNRTPNTVPPSRPKKRNRYNRDGQAFRGRGLVLPAPKTAPSLLRYVGGPEPVGAPQVSTGPSPPGGRSAAVRGSTRRSAIG